MRRSQPRLADPRNAFALRRAAWQQWLSQIARQVVMQ